MVNSTRRPQPRRNKNLVRRAVLLFPSAARSTVYPTPEQALHEQGLIYNHGGRIRFSSTARFERLVGMGSTIPWKNMSLAQKKRLSKHVVNALNAQLHLGRGTIKSLADIPRSKRNKKWLLDAFERYKNSVNDAQTTHWNQSKKLSGDIGNAHRTWATRLFRAGVVLENIRKAVERDEVDWGKSD